MSGFDRALGALSRQEMLECARGLLKVLAGDSSTSAAGGGAGGPGGDVGRVGARRAFDRAAAEAGASGGAFGPAAGRAGRDARQLRGSERARRGGFDALEGAENVPERGGAPDGAESVRGRGGALDGPERRERAFSPPSRERVSRGDFDRSDGAGAAFAGPERRYENAVGARGMEMSRVSDYFRRDSRRYDAGFKRF